MDNKFQDELKEIRVKFESGVLNEVESFNIGMKLGKQLDRVLILEASNVKKLEELRETTERINEETAVIKDVVKSIQETINVIQATPEPEQEQKKE